MTPTKKGISIQNPVRRAQAGWPSSQRKMHVLKSVRTSKRLKSTLKNVYFKIWNILKNKENHYFLKVTISEHQYGFLPAKFKKKFRSHRFEKTVIPALSKIHKITEGFKIRQA